jgi:type II secretory pathway pseudopilin PulG
VFSESVGASLVEAVIVLAIMASVLGVGLPVFINGTDAKRTRDGAAFLAGQFRLARQRAALTSRNVAVVFDEQSGDFFWRLCEDRDRDGVSRADITSQVDVCEAPPEPLSSRFSGVLVAYGPDVPSPDGELGVPALRFGPAQMAVFTPTGTSSGGTVAILGPGSNQFAVRVSGVTGRTRILRFDPGSRGWSE